MAYEYYVRKLNIKNLMLVRIIADLSRNYRDLITKPTYWTVMESNSPRIDDQY